MKCKAIILLLVLFLGLSYMLTACSAEEDQIKVISERGVLRVGVKVDVPRFGYQNPATGEMEGMEIDLARMIAKDITGDENAVKFVNVTAQTRGPMLDSGEIDIIIATFTITEERKESFNFSRPYYTDEIGYLVGSNSNITKPEDLNGRNIGVVQSSTAKSALEAECARLNIDVAIKECASYPEVMVAFSNGDADAFVADKSILYGYMDGTCELLDAGFNPQQYGIASKLENDKLAAYIDEFIEAKEKNGEIAAIFEKWGL